MNTGLAILLIVLALAGGTFLGAFLVRKQVEKDIAEHPRLNIDAVRAMMSSMGQKPNEAKVQQVYRQIKNAQKETLKKK